MDIDCGALKRMYCDEKRTLKECANEFDCHFSTIARKLEEMGITRRDTSWRRKDMEDRFKEKFTEGKDDECWEWKASTHENGYGQFRISSDKHGLAHRASYRIYCGEIPDDKQINHTCHNRSCVNPNHLYLGTQSENAMDAIENGTWNEFYKYQDSWTDE